MRCPGCGSANCQAISESTSTGYSLGKGCCGWLFMGGPIGLLCGLCGMGKTESKIFWVCHNCGKKFQNGIKETDLIQSTPNFTQEQKNNKFVQEVKGNTETNNNIKFIADQDKITLVQQDKIAYSQRIKSGVEYFMQNLLYLKMRTAIENRLIIGVPQDIQKNMLCSTLIRNCCQSMDAVKNEFIYFCLDTNMIKIDGRIGLVATTEGIYFMKGVFSPKPSFISRDNIFNKGIVIKPTELVVGDQKINLAALSESNVEFIARILKGIYQVKDI